MAYAKSNGHVTDDVKGQDRDPIKVRVVIPYTLRLCNFIAVEDR